MGTLSRPVWDTKLMDVLTSLFHQDPKSDNYIIAHIMKLKLGLDIECPTKLGRLEGIWFGPHLVHELNRIALFDAFAIDVAFL